jgi:hypothetical protein
MAPIGILPPAGFRRLAACDIAAGFIGAAQAFRREDFIEVLAVAHPMDFDALGVNKCRRPAAAIEWVAPNGARFDV